MTVENPLNVKKPRNEEKHVLKVLGIFTLYYLLMSCWPSLQPGFPFIFLFAGILAELSWLKFRLHILAYAAFLTGFLYLVKEPYWWAIIALALVAYGVGRFIGMFLQESADYHKKCARQYRNDLEFAEKIKKANEQRAYEEAARKVAAEQHQFKGSFKKKEVPLESKVIQFKK